MAQKYALAVGCNYPNSESPLMGCINDANSMHDILIQRFGFKESNVELLTDEPGSKKMPTSSNIKTVMNNFLTGAKPGDLVFFFFAGQGTTVPGNHSSSGEDEQAIISSDLNFITCMDFRALLKKIPDGVTFVFMSDSSYSGKLMDVGNEQIGPNHNVTTRRGIDSSSNNKGRMISFESILHQLSVDIQDFKAQILRLFGLENSLTFCHFPGWVDDWINWFCPRLHPGQGIMISGCQPDEFNEEMYVDGKYHGVFTWAVLDVLKNHNGRITNRELVIKAREFIDKTNAYDQHPCLYCDDDNSCATFLHE